MPAYSKNSRRSIIHLPQTAAADLWPRCDRRREAIRLARLLRRFGPFQRRLAVGRFRDLRSLSHHESQQETSTVMAPTVDARADVAPREELVEVMSFALRRHHASVSDHMTMRKERYGCEN